MSDGTMTYEDWLRGCVHHDGRHGYVTLPCDEVLKIADFIEKLRADRKTEPTISETERVEDEPQTEVDAQTHMDNVLTYIADKYQTTKEDLLEGLIKEEPTHPMR